MVILDTLLKMAVGVGTDDCTEFTKLVDYDPWVVPHQLLPAMAIVAGIEWKEVIIIMYLWESLEVIFLNCLKVSDGEHTPNSLISDPVQCFLGVATAMILLRCGNSVPSNGSSKLRAYFWSTTFIIPGVPIIIGGDYVWIYIPLWFLATYAFHHFNIVDSAIVLYFLLYCLVLSVPIFTLKDEFNSFYLGVISSVLISALSLLLKIRN